MSVRFDPAVTEPENPQTGKSRPLDDADYGYSRRIWPWTRVVLWLINGYQRAMDGRPSPCRFTPSCSTYASESLRIHGLIKGSGLAIWRILRCNPWGGQGFDPVPRPRRSRSTQSVRKCSHKHHNHLEAN